MRRMIPRPGNIALYRGILNGSVVPDLGGNGLDGANNGATLVTGITGMPFTTALNFVAASSQYVDLGANALWGPGTIAFAAWIRPTAANLTTTGTIIAQWDRALSANLGWFFQNNADTLVFQCKDGRTVPPGGANCVAQTGSVLVANRWFLVGCGYDENYARCFVYDPVLNVVTTAETAAANSGPIQYTGTVGARIGSHTGGGNYWDGDIAEIMVDDEARAVWDHMGIALSPRDPAAGFEVDPTTTIACYNFDGDLTDDTGDHDGSGGTGTSYVDAAIGPRALSFPRSSTQKVTVPHHADLNLSADRTLEAWIRPAVVDAASQWVCAKRAAGVGNYNLGFKNTPAKFTFLIYDDSANGGEVLSTTTVEAGKLYYVVAVLDAVNFESRIFVNGIYEGSFNLAAAGITDFADVANAADLYFGSNYNDSSPLSDELQAFLISNYAKSYQEINQTYTGKNMQVRSA